MKFAFKGAEIKTLGDMVGAMAEVLELARTDEGAGRARAKEFAEAYTEAIVAAGRDGLEARDVARSNIGFLTGEFGFDDMRKLQRLFGMRHPLIPDEAMTPDEVFKAGQEWAKGLRDLGH